VSGGDLDAGIVVRMSIRPLASSTWSNIWFTAAASETSASTTIG
jgi:hypothetical protein